MDARFNYQGSTVAAKFAKYINSAGAVVSNSTLPAATQELVKIRASQINGCAACTDMHTKDAEHAGESSALLNLVAVWREAKVFTEAERAAMSRTLAPGEPQQTSGTEEAHHVGGCEVPVSRYDAGECAEEPVDFRRPAGRPAGAM
jgi:AhpD family alkylhydroperoxidase